MKRYIDESEDEELNQFETSPVMNELVKQQAPVTNIPDQGEMIEQEMSAANEIANESMDLSAKNESVMPIEMSPTMQKKAEYEDMLAKMTKLRPAATSQDELKALQKQSLDNSKMLNYFRIGDKLATAYGNRHGGKGQGFQDIYDNLEKQGQQPISDYTQLQKDEATQMELGNEREMNDPNSDISKFSQQRAVAIGTKMGMNPEEVQKLTKMTAKQLEKLGFKGTTGLLQTPKPEQQSGLFGKSKNGKLFPLTWDGTIGKYKNPLTGELVGPETEIMRNVLSTDAFGNKITFGSEGSTIIAPSTRNMKSAEELNKETKFSPDKEQRTALDAEASRIDSLTKNANEKIGAANRILSALDGDSKQAYAVIKTQMPRLAGEVGNLNQQEQEVWQGSQAWLDRAVQYFSTGISSELTDENKVELRKILAPFLEDAKNSIGTIKESSAGRLAQVYNIPPDFAMKAYGSIKNITPRQEEVMAGQTGDPKKSSGKTVIKKGYNPKTNQTQLIYSDGTKKVVDGKQ